MALLSVWGIILVVLGHSGFEEPIIQSELSGLHSWIYSFHMPLFFLISGYLFSLTNPEFEKACTGKFVQKKIKRLLIPYVMIGTVIFGVKYVFAGLSHATRVFSIENFFKMFVIPSADYSTIGHLWYVFTLFMIFLVVLVLIGVRLISDKRLWSVALAAIGLWLLNYLLPSIKFLNGSSVLYYAPFFLLGILLQRYYEQVGCLFETSSWGQKCILYFTLTIVLTFIHVSGLCYMILRAICGILLSLSLCDFIMKHLPRLEETMVHFSNKTYTIYLLSWFGHYMVKVILVNVLNCHYLIVVAGMFAGGLLFPLAICRVVDKLPLLNKKGLRLIIGY